MKAFEVWYEKEFPLPPTIERGPIGRDRKDGCKQSWKAALKWAREKAENYTPEDVCCFIDEELEDE